MCSKILLHVKVLHREGVPSDDIMSLPLVACSAAQVAVAF